MARFGPRVPLISLVVRSLDTVTAIISSYDHLVPQRGLALHVGSCPSGPSSPSGRTSSSSCCRSRTRPRPPPWPRLPRRASTRRGARREGGRDDESVNVERDDAKARPPGSSPLALFRWPTAPIAILATRRRPRRRDDDRWTARSDGADPQKHERERATTRYDATGKQRRRKRAAAAAADDDDEDDARAGRGRTREEGRHTRRLDLLPPPPVVSVRGRRTPPRHPP